MLSALLAKKNCFLVLFKGQHREKSIPIEELECRARLERKIDKSMPYHHFDASIGIGNLKNRISIDKGAMG